MARLNVDIYGHPPRINAVRVGLPPEVATVGIGPQADGNGQGPGPRKGGRESTPRSKRKKGRGGVRRVSGCESPEKRNLLLPYALAKCSEDEAVTFEAHMLACASCFQALKTLDRAGNLLRQAINSPSPALDRLRLALGGARFVVSGGSHPRTPRV
jgi:hypothetical protein